MKPSDFYLTVSDFFAILLPGAALTFVALAVARRLDFPTDHAVRDLIGLQDTAAWLAFGATSYTAGHFVASLGSRLDRLYDDRRRQHGSITLRLHADKLLDMFLAKAERLTEIAGSIERDRAKQLAADHDRSHPRSKVHSSVFVSLLDGVLLRSAWQGEMSHGQLINAYKLARSVLCRLSPALYSEMSRHEADSKFFRSFVVVAAFSLLALAGELTADIVAAIRGAGPPTLSPIAWGAGYLVAVLLLLRLAFARFCDLRLKATELGFQGLLALAIDHDRPSAEPPAADLV